MRSSLKAKTIYTWACTGLYPTTWFLGILEKVGINSYHIIDVIGCVTQQSDGSWNWYISDDSKNRRGNAFSQREAIRQVSIKLNIKGYFTSYFSVDSQ